jgi:glycosyltransferase involved in cell wall biosynthesis
MSILRIVSVLPRSQTAHLDVLRSSLDAAGVHGSLEAVVVDDGPVLADRSVEHALRVLSSDGDALARALRPFVLAQVLAAHGGPIVGLSATTRVFAPLDPLGAVPMAGGVRLLRTWLDPTHAPAAAPAGGTEASCVAVSEEGVDFLQRWAARELDRACGLVGAGGLDEAAALFEHEVARDPGLGVTAWNAAERRLSVGPDGSLRALGEPLRTFDFASVDPHRPHVALSAPAVAPPILLSEHPVLRRLYAGHADDLLAAGYDAATQRPYGWGRLPAGITLDAAMRRAFRDAYRDARLSLTSPPPDPFEPGGFEAFVTFLNEPSPSTPGSYSRYVHALLETWPGLTGVFHDVLGAGRRHFVDWLNRFARIDGPIPSIIDLPTNPPAVRAGPPTRQPGVNVAGYLRADLGLGVAARRTVAALESAAVPVHPVVYRRTMSRQDWDAADSEPTAPFDVNLVCVTAEQFPFFRVDMGEGFFASRHTIGYWFWELEQFPPDQLGSLDLVDEVWVATRHVLDSIAPHTTKPVLHMPIPLVEPAPSRRDRAAFGLGPGYTFLYVFDFNSVIERKNPLGAIEAFTRAFAPGEGPQLVLKTINGNRWPEHAELLRTVIAERPDIVLYDTYLSEEDQSALVAACDCYVSLHRAEGLGLTLADAMALGKPVIATGYSGNLDFMNDDNSFLVPFEYTTVPPGVPAYPAGARWAEPDVDDAAEIMRRLAGDPTLGVKVGARARRDVLERWSVDAVGRRMRARLEGVWSDGRVPRA